MKYLFGWIVKAISIIVWVMVMIFFGIVLLIAHLWTFKNIHWKKVWDGFLEEVEDPKELLEIFLNYGNFK